jgi:transposase-like protein
MGKQMRNEDIKRAALALLAKGLVTMSEAARLAGVSRQLVRYWARDIPVDDVREQLLLKMWARKLGRYFR